MGFRQWLSKAQRTAEAGLAEEMQGAVVDVLRTIHDPEIPVNIYDLGLIYGLAIDAERPRVRIRMTLTAPGCPVAQTFPGAVADAVRAATGIEDVQVELVWDPPWSQDRISEAARLELGLL